MASGGRIVGQGSHRKPGGPHAEVLALSQAGARAKGGTLYVTLEPCSHLKKRTPPCVPLVIRSGVRRVVVAMVDPNPLVSGRGIAQLKEAGISVVVGCGEQEAVQLNEAYCHWIQTGRPFTILKAGMTLDGKIATAVGESQWITDEAARLHAHRLRAEVDAILVGVGTVLCDDPRLTVRLPNDPISARRRQPLRVVVDSRLRIPSKAAVLEEQTLAHTLIATTGAAPIRKVAQLRRRGIDVLVLPKAEGASTSQRYGRGSDNWASPACWSKAAARSMPRCCRPGSRSGSCVMSLRSCSAGRTPRGWWAAVRPDGFGRPYR
ncbi:MAG: bifunctional daminohydroxyphosphoribosylaminopyrimidine deaminase/5-amino-6-(5-phosphoribosylamino)uracil reductase [Nitrospira sp. OLB3]|nr:MAG: bifunctional daminohydroxyphosphoribosylaminopyrimidine deaminase/5-amino-6-(5-phosphoribosylamino)uracil reductase [Nitrospira sp. OLB3]